MEAMAREIAGAAENGPGKLPVHTIFFGGGTPSLLNIELFEKIFSAIHGHFEVMPVKDRENPEISMEANPGTVTQEGLKRLRKAGLNRISFGVQSAHPQELRQLERIHDFLDVIESVKWARQAGFANINLDLIYGLPEQPLSRWQESLNKAISLNPEHLSLYALTLETGTPFGHWAAKGLMPMPDPDLAADMYEWASEKLESEGYEQYEISNWAKAGYQCRHNLQYWRNEPYLGLGAGAHGFANGIRYSNVLRIKTYIERLNEPTWRKELKFPLTPAVVSQEFITKKTEMQETMITGLRLTREGVGRTIFEGRFGKKLEDVFGNEIDELVRLALLEWTESCLRLTQRGRLLGNQVFIRFVG